MELRAALKDIKWDAVRIDIYRVYRVVLYFGREKDWELLGW
jgi:hypothetical protein